MLHTSIALKVNPLTGELRVAGHTIAANGDSRGTWRNGGPTGDSTEALQQHPEYDTNLLRLVLDFIGDNSAQPISITPNVLTLKARRLHTLQLGRALDNLLQNGSEEVEVISWGETPKPL